MHKYLVPVLTAVLIPVALLLVLSGTRALRSEKRSGLGLKLALILNTSLTVALGWLGCARADYPETLCYATVATADEPVPDAFDKSRGWNDLEKTMVELESKISAGDFDNDKYTEFYERISNAQLKLGEEGILDSTELQVVGAYCAERLAWYLHMVGGATCYEAVVIPPGPEATLNDAVTRAMELRGLYAKGAVGGPAYDASLTALENDLRDYTGAEDVSTLRQLILDLADGVKYE